MKKKNKKSISDIVEISKSAFRYTRQSKSTSREEIIRKTVDDEVVTNNNAVVGQSDGAEEETTATNDDDDVVEIYRDVLSMTDDDRNTDSDGNSTSVRLSPPPRPSWSDDEENIKFSVGTFVRYKGNTKGSVYKVCGPSTKNDTYSIKASMSQECMTEEGFKLVKVSGKDVDWVDYWKTIPVILAPKPWLTKKN